MEKTTREFYLAVKVDALQAEVAELKMAQAQYIKMLSEAQRAMPVFDADARHRQATGRWYRRLYLNKMGVDCDEV